MSEIPRRPVPFHSKGRVVPTLMLLLRRFLRLRGLFRLEPGWTFRIFLD